jgi:hypothetical protein
MNPHSAKTSLNQVSALHKWLLAKDSKIPTFDFGAGKAGKVDQAFNDFLTSFFPYDPFCRSKEENKQATNALELGLVGHLTCANVLNVLEDGILQDTITCLATLTKCSWLKVCYVSVYYKSGLPANRIVGKHFQRNQPIDWYIPHLEKSFKKVDKVGKFLVCFA